MKLTVFKVIATDVKLLYGSKIKKWFQDKGQMLSSLSAATK